jgi:hypothetical protein
MVLPRGWGRAANGFSDIVPEESARAAAQAMNASANIRNRGAREPEAGTPVYLQSSAAGIVIRPWDELASW